MIERDDNWDQPPGVDIHDSDKTSPPSVDAAGRVNEFIGQWGDGDIAADRPSGLPLYARDLEAMTKAIERISELHNADGRRLTGFPRATEWQDYCDYCGEPSPCRTQQILTRTSS